MNAKKEELKNLPGVDRLLCLEKIKHLTEIHNRDIVIYAVRNSIEYFRNEIISGRKPPSVEEVAGKVEKIIENITRCSLKKIINATGIIIHTNLGRAPLGENLLEDVQNVLSEYNNLEFDTNTGKRGQRNKHISEILKYLTGAEDVMVVNNNAAAVMLILRTFAKNKEVIISRGELIEIGGSFRIPDIMAVSDCIMKEVGTTNKTSIDDYKNAITENTALFFKAHKSNYIIRGFTKEASLSELVKLGKEKNIPVVYDIGSGLLRKIGNNTLQNEPDVKQSLSKDVDLICFSGDKLLGGPQAGIIAGKKEFIEILKKQPLFRALRVGKTTIALLEKSCSYYLNDNILFAKNRIFKILGKDDESIKQAARELQTNLLKKRINAEMVKSSGQYGGGTMPDVQINSYAVKIIVNERNKTRSEFAEKMYRKLLKHENPVLAILKNGNIYFDVLTLSDKDIRIITKTIHDVYSQLKNGAI